jgi:hypothetical protein
MNGTRWGMLGLVWACVACGEDADPLVPAVDDEVLVLTQSAGLEWFPDSFYQGSLVFDGAGCIRLDLPSGDDASVVWPSGTTLWTRGDRRVLRDSSGRELYGEGDRLRFSGGYIAAIGEVSDYSAAQREAARERCPGPYWLVTPGSVRRFSS